MSALPFAAVQDAAAIELRRAADLIRAANAHLDLACELDPTCTELINGITDQTVDRVFARAIDGIAADMEGLN